MGQSTSWERQITESPCQGNEGVHGQFRTNTELSLCCTEFVLEVMNIYLCFLSFFWVNTGSGNRLLPDGTKPLPEPMLTDHQWSPVAFILGQFQKTCLNHQSLKSVWKCPRGQWVEDKGWFLPHKQYHGCWQPADIIVHPKQKQSQNHCSHCQSENNCYQWLHRIHSFLYTNNLWCTDMIYHFGSSGFHVITNVFINDMQYHWLWAEPSLMVECIPVTDITAVAISMPGKLNRIFSDVMDPGRIQLHINTLRLRQNGCHFANDILQIIFSNKYCYILIQTSIKYTPKGQINNKSVLVHLSFCPKAKNTTNPQDLMCWWWI